MKNIVKRICLHCNKEFEIDQRFIKYGAKRKQNCGKYCSSTCSYAARVTAVTKQCSNCNKTITVILKETKKSKSGNNFCSRSCAAKYNNRHKTTGTRRSKLEVWLHEQLAILYPELEIKDNKIEDVGMELDLFIPSLKLAFELNGIFHYKPIYGLEKFASIQRNDIEKKRLCEEKNVKLVIYDVSGMKKFTEKAGQEYLDLITKEINLAQLK